jgi:lysophospholipase L1-like esterase
MRQPPNGAYVLRQVYHAGQLGAFTIAHATSSQRLHPGYRSHRAASGAVPINTTSEGTSVQPDEAAEPHWVRAWYGAPSRLIQSNLTGRTFRQIVQVRADGDHVRLHLSNRYGEAPVTLSAVSVAPVLIGPMVKPGGRDVHFSGESTVTLQPGAEVVSDPAALSVTAFTDLAVTWFLADGEPLSGHAVGTRTAYISRLGDVTRLPPEASFVYFPLQTRSLSFLTGIDVVPQTPVNVLVAFGSSTTQGAGSTVDTNRSWPDQLASRLRGAGGSQFMTVVNAGIGGNQLTSSLLPDFMQAVVPMYAFGEAGLNRFAWDALTQPGATDLIVNIGSNDLRAGVSADALIEGYQNLATQARTVFQRVFGSTIMPGNYPGDSADQRRRANDWLRDQGSQYFDAVFEFAIPLQAPDDEVAMNAAYDSGDGFHPNDEGYRVVAEAVDISMLTGSPGRTA